MDENTSKLNNKKRGLELSRLSSGQGRLGRRYIVLPGRFYITNYEVEEHLHNSFNVIS
jgi:hypothetical protein